MAFSFHNLDVRCIAFIWFAEYYHAASFYPIPGPYALQTLHFSNAYRNQMHSSFEKLRLNSNEGFFIPALRVNPVP